MHMSEIQDTDKIYVPGKGAPVRKKFPLIILPAIIALGVMVIFFLLTAIASAKQYNVIDGIFGSPHIGLTNYEKAGTIFGTALQNTLLVKVIMLAVCGGLSAALCAMYKAMKKPGTVLTVACLWLVPLVLPTFMLTLASIRWAEPASIFGAGLLHILSEGLQTVSLFCITAGIFAYLNIRKGTEAGKGAYSGLLAAVLIWLLGSLTTNGILYIFQNSYLFSRTFDSTIYTHSLIGDRGAGNALSVCKILLQVLIGIIPVIFLRRRTCEKAPAQNEISGEFRLFLIAGIGLVPLLFSGRLAESIGDVWYAAAANSILLSIAAGSLGCLLAWSLIRLMSRSSGKAFGIIALILAAALSCPFIHYIALRLLFTGESLLPQVITVIFDWRMMLVTVVIAFILRNHKACRPGSLMAALALLAGAFSWSGLINGLFYGTSQGYYTLSYRYYLMMSNLSKITAGGVISAYGAELRYWPFIVLIYAAPLLLGLGAALLTRKAFREAE